MCDDTWNTRKAAVYSRSPELDSPGVWESCLSYKSIAALQTLPSTPLIWHQDIPSLLTEHMSLEDTEPAFKSPFMTSNVSNFN